MTDPRSPFSGSHGSDHGEVTRLLASLGAEKDDRVYDQLLPLIYQELHGLAAGFLGRERVDHTLQPTALVHEAYLKLSGQRDAGWESRGHFFAIAATAMRRILVDHARGQKRRRKDERERDVLDSDFTAVQADPLDLLDLDAALEKLARMDPRKVRVVELRYFAGLDVEATAASMGVSTPTVIRDWRMAKLWLKSELDDA